MAPPLPEAATRKRLPRGANGAMAKPYRGGKYYRERAQECRVVAEMLPSVKLRDKMLTIADDYERLADAADRGDQRREVSEDLPPLR